MEKTKKKIKTQEKKKAHSSAVNYIKCDTQKGGKERKRKSKRKKKQ